MTVNHLVAGSSPAAGANFQGPVLTRRLFFVISCFMYYVYILGLGNGQLYTDFSGDLKRRISEHQSGEVRSTKHRRPLVLIHYEAYLQESDARRREKFLKTTEGKRLLKQQVRDVLMEDGSPRHPTGRPVE